MIQKDSRGLQFSGRRFRSACFPSQRPCNSVAEVDPIIAVPNYAGVEVVGIIVVSPRSQPQAETCHDRPTPAPPPSRPPTDTAKTGHAATPADCSAAKAGADCRCAEARTDTSHAEPGTAEAAADCRVAEATA